MQEPKDYPANVRIDRAGTDIAQLLRRFENIVGFAPVRKSFSSRKTLLFEFMIFSPIVPCVTCGVVHSGNLISCGSKSVFIYIGFLPE